MHIRIYHKSLWPKYKGAIFSVLHRLSQARGVEIIAAVEICERPPVGVLDTEATGNFQYGPRCGEAGSQHAVDLA